MARSNCSPSCRRSYGVTNGAENPKGQTDQGIPGGFAAQVVLDVASKHKLILRNCACQFAVYVALRSSGPVPPIPVRSRVKVKLSPLTWPSLTGKGSKKALGASLGGTTVPENRPVDSLWRETSRVAVSPGAAGSVIVHSPTKSTFPPPFAREADRKIEAT
jgi:hypothetical protein